MVGHHHHRWWNCNVSYGSGIWWRCICLELGHCDLSHHFRHHTNWRLFRYGKLRCQISSNASPYFRFEKQHSMSLRSDLPWLQLHRRILLPTTLLPSRPRSHTSTLRRMDISLRTSSILHVSSNRHLHPQNRPLQRTHLARHLPNDHRLRPIHQLPSLHLLATNHHLPNHRRRRSRTQLPSPPYRPPSQAPTTRHRRSNSNLWFRT